MTYDLWLSAGVSHARLLLSAFDNRIWAFSTLHILLREYKNSMPRTANTHDTFTAIAEPKRSEESLSKS
jgi:hypothetical protein